MSGSLVMLTRWRPGLARFLGTAVLTALLGTAVSTSPCAEEPPLVVVATTGMIADAARQVGGRDVRVQALMGPGTDPHGFRQTRTDITAMLRADLILWHGLDLEAQLKDVLARLARKKTVVAVAESLPENLLRAHDTYRDKFDPHVWMDPEIWKRVVRAIADALIAARPAQRQTFERATTAYMEKLSGLASYARTVLATVPPQQRVLVTAHDAFYYFGAAYGFEVRGIQGISTESEAGLSRVRDLADFLVSRKINAVFVESSVSERSVRALVEGAAAQGHTVRIGGQLYSDAMGPDGTHEGTYLGMIEHNVTVIAGALGGRVSRSGLGERTPGTRATNKELVTQ